MLTKINDNIYINFDNVRWIMTEIDTYTKREMLTVKLSFDGTIDTIFIRGDDIKPFLDKLDKYCGHKFLVNDHPLINDPITRY